MARNAQTKAPGPRDWAQMRQGKREVREDPTNFIKIGTALHPVKNTDLIVIKLSEGVVPYFSAGIYGEGNRRIASVHEVFGKFDDNVFCSIRIEDKLQASAFPTGAVFRADKFKCLDFDRVKGASKVATPTSAPRQPRAGAPAINRARSSKFRTHTANDKVRRYAESQISQNKRDARNPNNRAQMVNRTIEKKGSYVKINRRTTFTD
ncbi:H/ACA ribonucleoprotein complex subunit 1 [Nematocida displodere]|uniref:H/ACA ribonucleoprotein complex subunit 1 n=1 Tax=Nematocida displodere TaxID=1805483 RepID=A0A177EIA3_9MICR|nr:H/ACA ribonucleoprotein complex subunit 1 [Nematocida displodere]